jgi:excisionase family DNA binding protein
MPSHTLTPAQTHDIQRNPPALLSALEAAAFLRISERTLRELVRLQRLKALRIGKRIVIRIADLNAFLEGLAA